MRATNETGNKYGKLTVLCRVENNPRGKQRVRCRCECGAEIEVLVNSLRTGNTRSCGCAMGEGHITHGLNRSLTHRIWCNMKTRCTNPKATGYNRYGGRGVTICDRWQSFENFLEDMGECPSGMSLDRYPNRSGNYDPDNCRWATRQEQGENRDSTRRLEAFGEIKTVREWMDDPRCVAGLGTFNYRIVRGWAIEDALTRPVRRRGWTPPTKSK